MSSVLPLLIPVSLPLEVETGRFLVQLPLLSQALLPRPQLLVLDGRLVSLESGVLLPLQTGVMPLLPSQLSNGKFGNSLWTICIGLVCSMVNLIALYEGKISCHCPFFSVVGGKPCAMKHWGILIELRLWASDTVL